MKQTGTIPGKSALQQVNTPDKDFVVQGYIPNIPSMIDPCVFVDDDGQAYLFYGGGGNCMMGKLKDNMMEIDGELKAVNGVGIFS